MAITDSPNATIITSPCRSTKCPALSWNCGRSTRYGIANWTATEAPHRRSWAVPSSSPPVTTSAALTRFSPPIRSTERSGTSAPANIPVCTAITRTYARPKATPLPSKACGTVSEITRKPVMPSSSRPRRGWVVGGMALVSQMKASYIHQITASITSTLARPATVRWWARLSLSWVMVKTKTRSKNSSSGLTRRSASAGRSS